VVSWVNLLMKTLITLGSTYLKNQMYRGVIEDYKRALLSKAQVPQVKLDLSDILKIGEDLESERSDIDRELERIVSKPRESSNPGELQLDANEYTKRELIKSLRLLEKHLTQAAYMPENFCMECAIKHLLEVEGLAEEGLQFAANERERDVYRRIAEWSYRASETLPKLSVDPVQLGREARGMRKQVEELASEIAKFLHGLESRLERGAESQAPQATG